MVYWFCSNRLHLHRINSFVKDKSNLAFMWRYLICPISKFEAAISHPEDQCFLARKICSIRYCFLTDSIEQKDPICDARLSIWFNTVRKFAFLLQKGEYFYPSLTFCTHERILPTWVDHWGLSLIWSAHFDPVYLPVEEIFRFGRLQVFRCLFYRCGKFGVFKRNWLERAFEGTCPERPKLRL